MGDNVLETLHIPRHVTQVAVHATVPGEHGDHGNPVSMVMANSVVMAQDQECAYIRSQHTVVAALAKDLVKKMWIATSAAQKIVSGKLGLPGRTVASPAVVGHKLRSEKYQHQQPVGEAAKDIHP